MKSKKRAINIAMTLFLFITMAAPITGIDLHKIIGTILILLFLFHQFLNRNWFKSLPKGKYNLNRKLQIVLNFLLLFSFFTLIISGFLLSSTASNIGLLHRDFGRKLHMLGSSWAFVLIATHMGMHWNLVMSKIKRKKFTFPRFILSILPKILIITSVYLCTKRQVFQKMFWQIDFPFHDYNEHPILFFIDYLLILFGGVVLGHHLFLLTQKLSKKRSKKRKDSKLSKVKI